jgi:hypothetical protein
MAPHVRAVIEGTLKQRTERLQQIETHAATVATSDLANASASQLSEHLLRLDAHEVEMDEMRDAITAELDRYEAQSRELRERNAAMEAARLGAALSRPPKGTPG